MTEPYQRPVARIFNADSTIVGAGFAAPWGVVITCAHVVNAALGREKLEPGQPNQAAVVSLDLPWARGPRHTATIIDWRPPAQPGSGGSDPCVDIAVLTVEGAFPLDCAVAPQPPVAVLENTVFRVMGFPAGANDGAPFRGEVRATDARGWHHVEADRGFGRTLEPGFSGAPAIGPGERVVGIVDIVNPGERRGVLIPVEALMRAWPPLAEPYRGLEPFREEDAAYFFGRETFVNRLWQSFDRHPVTLVIGPSGSGKSSLINAGFLPRLRRQEGWRVVQIHPGNRPIENLARELVTALKPGANAFELDDEVERRREALLADPARLVSYARSFRATGRCRICLVIDQFEETFTLARSMNPAEHNAVLAGLACIGRQAEPSLKAILGMRSDFQTLLQADDAATELIDAVNGDPTIMLRRLDPRERERVIRGPLDRLEVSIEDGLLGRMVDDIANNPDALPLLEFALASLWRLLRIDGRRRFLTHEAYDRIGGLSGAVAKYADEVVEGLKADFDLVKGLFIELIRVSDTTEQDARRPRSKDHLDAIDPALWPLAQELAGKRLLTATDEPAVDIVHEALFRRWDRLAGWIHEERDFLRWRQRLEDRLRDWEDSRRDPNQLLKGAMLDDAVDWLGTHRDALKELEIEFISDSEKEATAERVSRQSHDLWERLEFNWEFDKAPPHDVQVLRDLSCAAKEVKLSFLLTAATTEARARRFNRRPTVALRAALGLDAAQAEDLAGRLTEALRRPGGFAREERRAVLEIGRSLVVLAPDLSTPLAELAICAIKKTTDPTDVLAYAETVRGLVGKIGSAIARAATEVLIEHLVFGIPETTTPRQDEAYREMIRAFAEKLENDAACATVERCVSAICETAEPSVSPIAQARDARRLQIYDETIRALADKLDSTTARTTVERSVSAIAGATEADGLQTTRIQALVRTIEALAKKLDSATARAAVERSVACAAETRDPYQLWAYAVTIKFLGEKIDCPTNRASVGVIVELLVSGIAETEAIEQLRVYASIIGHLADRVDSATVRNAAQAIVERSIASIAKTTDRDQSELLYITVPADPGNRVREVLERLAANLAETTDTDRLEAFRKTNRLRAYADTIQALADKVDSATASAVMERSVSRIGKISDPEHLRAYADTIQALADKVDSVTASAVMEHSVSRIAETRDTAQLWAYASTIHALADKVGGAPTHGAAGAIIERFLFLFEAERKFISFEKVDYETTIRGLADKVDSATARAAVHRCISGIDRGYFGEAEKFAQMIRGFANTIDSSTACAAVEHLACRIAETNNAKQLQTYADTIQALAHKVDGAVARVVVEQSLSRIAETKDSDRLRAYAVAIVSLQTHLPREALIFATSEALKHPLAALNNVTEILLEALGTAVGLSQDRDYSLWAIVLRLQDCEPWLPLSRSWPPTDSVIAEFRHLLDRGPPLPHETTA
jgi:hypothetical protein